MSNIADMIPSSGTFSQDAEKNIIKGLLSFLYFKNPVVQRKIAYYVYADFDEKNHIICELMDIFWVKAFPGKASQFSQKFDVFRKFEIFLTATGRKGHFIHQFEVFLLGLSFIISILSKKHGVERYLVADLEHVFLTWLIASSAHDFGLPLEIASEITGSLAHLYKDMGLLFNTKKMKTPPSATCKPCTKIEALINEGIKRSLNITDTEAARIGKILEKSQDHGYAGATILCQEIQKFISLNKLHRPKTEKSIYDAFILSIGSTALHSCIKVKKPSMESFVKKIDFGLNPYAYLLFFIDNIQDWNRSIVPNPAYPKYTLVNISSNDNFYKIEYMLQHNQWTGEVISNTKSYIKDKIRLLNLPIKPSPPLGIKFMITFDSNGGANFDPLEIEL